MSGTHDLTDDEKLEIELGEKARIASDSWDSVAPGKATDFGASFRRMIGLLRPHRVAWFLSRRDAARFLAAFFRVFGLGGVARSLGPGAPILQRRQAIAARRRQQHRRRNRPVEADLARIHGWTPGAAKPPSRAWAARAPARSTAAAMD